MTASVPEIVEALRDVDAGKLILDGEAIALDDSGAPQPFQQTMRRFGRTLDVADMRASLPLSVFFFDCLRRGAEALTAAPASERFDALARALPPAAGHPAHRDRRRCDRAKRSTTTRLRAATKA